MTLPVSFGPRYIYIYIVYHHLLWKYHYIIFGSYCLTLVLNISFRPNNMKGLLSSFVQYCNHNIKKMRHQPQDLIFFALISRGKVVISVLLYSPLPVFFGPSYYNFYISCSWSIAWHDRAEIKPSNTEGESSDFSFHLWTALLNILIHMSLTSPNHSCLFPLFPLFPFPSLPPLGKSEEVYGVCAAEKHWKGLEVPGKRPGPQLPWSRHRR